MGQYTPTGLYFAIPFYMLLMISVGAAAWRSNRRRTQKLAREGGTVADAISSHYLGGRELRVFTTMMTLFASLFSGYTVIGVPNEAFREGWFALRWTPTASMICIGQVGTSARLRKASMMRKHQSPTDFVTDRFQSQLLRYTVVCLQVFPAWLYLTAQLVSLSLTFNGMFNIDPDNPLPVIAISLFILFYEWGGGLGSVASLDVLNGTLMIIALTLLPVVVALSFGSWQDLQLGTYPRPDFFEPLALDRQFLFWNFVMQNFAFFSLPHLLQRVYAAKTMRALKAGYALFSIGPWFTTLPAVFVGTIGVWVLRDSPDPADPFSAIIEAVMEIDWFTYGLGCLVFTASLAAIVSTADSLLIAIGQMLTAEVVHPLMPAASPAKVSFVGKAFSVLSMGIAMIISFYAKQSIAQIIGIQSGMGLQAVPAWICGLYFPDWATPHPWVLAVSAWVGFFAFFVAEYVYNATEGTFQINGGLSSLLINVCFVALGELCLRLCRRRRRGEAPPSLPPWDVVDARRFGGGLLTNAMLARAMEGIYEPFLDGWLIVLYIVLSLLLLPGSYALDTDGNAEEGACRFAPRVAGMPNWAFRIILVSVLLSLLSLVVIHKVPDDIGEGSDGDGAKEHGGASSGSGEPKRGRLGVQRVSSGASKAAAGASGGAPRVEGERDVFATMAAGASAFSR